MMISTAICRRVSGSTFLIANIILFLTSYNETNFMHVVSSILFMSCSVSLYLSSYNHRWLFYGGGTVIVSYALVSFTNVGAGVPIQYLGGIIGVIGGVLIFRGGLQRETGKQYKLFYPLNLADLYPLAVAGIIEGGGGLLIAVGSFVNKDISLFVVSSLWVIAHMFLISSDEFLRKKLES